MTSLAASRLCRQTPRLWRPRRMFTDSLYILVGYLLKPIGGDRRTLEAIRRESSGSLYVEGEGLAEIEGLMRTGRKFGVGHDRL